MLTKIYNRSPVVLQNLMISAYGALVRRRRYGGVYGSTYRALLDFYNASSEEIKTHQEIRLREVVGYAVRHVPYYRTVLSGVDPSRINSDSFPVLVPLLDKHLVINKPKQFVSADPSLGKLGTINTSGTSGTPLNVHINSEALQTNYAFFSRVLNIAGVKKGQTSATFAGRIIIPEGRRDGPWWRRNYFMNNTLFSSYHISDKTIPSYIEEMDRLGLVYIDSYPSAIYEIARYINRENIRHGIRPRAIITSSETLLPQQREEIETAFGTRVYDHYGCAEMATLITQCAQGGYHINPDFGYVEILDGNNQPVGEGETGQLVCTGFINKCMPLIRYKIGDAAVFTGEKCACGCNFPLIKSIEGRIDDMITTLDGKKIGRLDPVYKGLKHIKESQIVQNAYNSIVVKLVRDQGFDEKTARVLKDNIKKRVGNDFIIEVEYVDQIARTDSGKFRSVVSFIK